MGSKVLAYTDNVALRYWKIAQNLSHRHVRWLAYIGMFDLDSAHITGITNTAADALSRLASPALCCPVIGSTTEDWKDAYKLDHRTRADHFDASAAFINQNAYHHGLLCDHDRIVVPRSKVLFAITQCHTGIIRGHWGPRKTFDLVARQYSFPNMKQLVAEFVRVCPTCQHVKHDRRGEQGLLQPLPLPTRK